MGCSDSKEKLEDQMLNLQDLIIYLHIYFFIDIY